MIAKFHLSWQVIKRPLVVAVIVGIVLVLIVVDCMLYGTGLVGKTLWDWLQLAIIPFMLAGGGYVFSQVQKNNDQKIAQDNQQETALQAYIDKMSELLLHEQLGESSPPDKVVAIAQARTATVLRILDSARRASLIQFLSGANILLVCVKDSLEGIDLQGANLAQLNLSGISLKRANLQKANLGQSRLIDATLDGANLRRAHLTDADLHKARFVGADLQGARLLSTNLEEAKFPGANLKNANLAYAVLHKASISQEQLQSAMHLQGAIMPDGSTHS